MADVSLSASVDTSGVAAGMAAIENQISRTANSVASKISGLFSAGVLIAEINKITEAAETIHREAARFGIDAEQLQVVTNAAKQLGLDIGQVARAMNLLEINAQKGIDPTTKQALAMEHLGISAKAFAGLSVDQKFFALADAYKNSAQDGQAYADVAELIGRRNTEMIPLLAEGSKAIIDRGNAMRIMSNEEVEMLHALKEEEKKYLASLDGILAQAIVGWGRLFTTLKHEYESFRDWLNKQPQPPATVPGMKSGQLGPNWQTGAAILPGPTYVPASSLINPPPGAAAPVGVTDITAGGLSGGGAVRGGGITLTADLAGLNNAEKLNELLRVREEIIAKINSDEEQGDEHAASRYQLTTRLAAVDKDIATIQQIINLEEIKGVQAADLKIQKSQDRVALQQLENQLVDAEFKGQTLTAQAIADQIERTKIELDFNEKIQKALDDANIARERGLEVTAQENELLAQQLETEKETALQLQQQREERQRIIDSYGPNPLTVNALAQNNLRLGATGDVYAQAVAASRGIQPGTPEYERLVQQIMAQDRLRQLQGGNLSFNDQLARDRLVQWFTQMQQQQASGRAAQSHLDEIAFWQAIAAGHAPPAGNPFINLFGNAPFTGFNTIPGATPAAANPQLSQLVTDSGQQTQLLQQIAFNTQGVHI